MKEELKQFKKEPDSFWQNAWRYGDGYDVMEAAKTHGWYAKAGWGKQGWDLGSWPYVIMFFGSHNGRFEVIEYVEGDVTLYSCPTKEIRQEITDHLAFFHWKHRDEEWVKPYASVEELPDELRGPYRP